MDVVSLLELFFLAVEASSSVWGLAENEFWDGQLFKKNSGWVGPQNAYNCIFALHR